MVLCLCIFSCSYYLFVPMCRSWIFLEFGKKLWLLCASARALEQHRSSTSGIWWLLIQADSSQDQNLLLLPTNALFWKCANEVHRIRSEVCGLKLSREVFKFWRKSLEFVDQLHSEGNRPSNSVYLACFSRVNWQQVNWTNSVDVLENMGLKKTLKINFKIYSVLWTEFTYQNLKLLFLLTTLSLSGGLDASLYLCLPADEAEQYSYRIDCFLYSRYVFILRCARLWLGVCIHLYYVLLY